MVQTFMILTLSLKMTLLWVRRLNLLRRSLWLWERWSAQLLLLHIRFKVLTIINALRFFNGSFKSLTKAEILVLFSIKDKGFTTTAEASITQLTISQSKINRKSPTWKTSFSEEDQGESTEQTETSSRLLFKIQSVSINVLENLMICQPIPYSSICLSKLLP